MKKITLSFSLVFLMITTAFLFQSFSKSDDKESWTENQLMQPAALAKIINAGNKPTTYIYNIGPAGEIKNSILIGDAKEKENLAKLKKALSTLSKDANIVIYCGCCPFKNCPNIRPAFKLLNEMKFTNHKLLDIKQNLKVDWIDKGYPMKE